MSERKSGSPARLAAYIALAVLIVTAVILGTQVSSLYDEMQWARSLTPTPLPAFGNALLVTPDPGAPTPAPVIRTGSSGESVWKLQERLQALGYYTGTVDGQFGPATQTAVKLFQQQHGLDADGVVGPATSTVLYSSQAHAPVITPTPTPAPTAQRPAGATQDGMPMLVNRTTYLPDGYEPVELVDMSDYCDLDLVTIKYDGTKAERVAVDALMEMLLAAHADGLTVWQVSAAWRSMSYQQQLFDDKVYEYRQQGFSGDRARSAASRTVAVPGTSEHHLGLAFDITVPGKFFIDTQQARWLAKNCWDYGFIIRYQEDKVDITGYEYEPWHIRYVGTAHSLIMRDQHLCLEEYLEIYGN